jgi:hypothetical protein
MVLTVITVYVLCWGPYYIHQMSFLYMHEPGAWAVILYQFLTFLTYSNSALNPLLYAFLSDNFRRSFLMAFRCASPADSGGLRATRGDDGRSSVAGRRLTNAGAGGGGAGAGQGEAKTMFIIQNNSSGVDATTLRNTHLNGSKHGQDKSMVELNLLTPYKNGNACEISDNGCSKTTTSEMLSNGGSN